MSFTDKTISWNNLIKFTKNGMIVANYSQVRSAIVEQFKSIYGNDIDLSSGCADGVYVETLSLMLSNILQSFKKFYAQLDVRSAYGTYLDALCALSNVYRNSESYSTCSVVLTLDDASLDTWTTSKVSLMDKNGYIWTYDGDEITFENGVPKAIVVTCEKSGPVSAVSGWIYKLVENNVTMEVSQTESAVLGRYVETDSELRARRNLSLGATGNTILETMIGTLYTITGIENVKIYNNDSGSTITALDKTAILSHDIYVILRQSENISIEDSLVCSYIYEKLTPGIRTTETTDTAFGEGHSYKYVQSISGVPIEGMVVQNVYWKVAKPITPKIKIKLKITTNYGSADNTTSNKIANNVIDYLNNLNLSSTFYVNDLWQVITYSDPKYRGQSTYSIQDIEIDRTNDAGSDSSSFTLPDTYFGYTTEMVEIDDPNYTSEETDLSTVTIVLGGNS